MVVRRSIQAAGCASCRLSLLRSFTAGAGVVLHPPRVAAQLSRPTTSRPRFLSRTAYRQENSQLGSNFRAIEQETEESEPIESVPDSDSLEVTSVPWYLQVQKPQTLPRRLSERQQIPELPQYPPPILEPLLNQLSIDLGLDSLSLLDLRKLDPPPALGANLIMVLGTARSEKHLHVSADRLCRWLRTTYKLRPDADGLLGRNELKLKLKRKTRRAKLMGTAVDDNSDDGVRTGWVCVDVGIVEGPEDQPVTLPPREFIGFGRRTEGIRLVVQMLTDEKRAELDLEKLWGGILRRSTTSEEAESSEESPGDISAYTPLLGGSTGPPQHVLPSIPGQSRGFHTLARCMSPEVECVSSPADELPSDDPSSTKYSDLQDIEKSISKLYFAPKIKRPKFWQYVLLKRLFTYLRGLPTQEAIEAVGGFLKDSNPGRFLRCYSQVVDEFPVRKKAEFDIRLYCYSRSIAPDMNSSRQLLDLLTSLQQRGIRISRQTYLLVLRTIMLAEESQAEIERNAPPRLDTERAMEVLRLMHATGEEILAEDVLVILQEACSFDVLNREETSRHENSELDSNRRDLSPVQHLMHSLITSVDAPCFSEETMIRLLELYSHVEAWPQFWEIWRMAPRQGRPRSGNLYAVMFNKVAETEHQGKCIDALRAWLPDLEREDPVVRLEGDVARAIQRCLLVAEPHVEEDASTGARGEFVPIWERCNQA